MTALVEAPMQVRVPVSPDLGRRWNVGRATGALLGLLLWT